MTSICRSFAALYLVFSVSGAAFAADNDPLHAAFEESRALNKGLTFYVNGQAIPGIVVSIGERYLVARSTAQGNIVIRIDRIDGIAGFVAVERKTP
jgi:hypothetical protein